MSLVYYRGASECKSSRWCQSGDELAALMGKIACETGGTQLGRVFEHALREHDKVAVQGVTYIGDALEEQLEPLAALASKLGNAGCPLFMFQEGSDPTVRAAYRLLALKSGGMYFAFDPNKSRAVEQLSAQLNGIARLAVGDTGALESIGTAAV